MQNIECIVNSARITHNGKIYHLYQDAGLFAIDWDNLTSEEKHNLGFDDYA